jgi:hypothetical protein
MRSIGLPELLLVVLPIVTGLLFCGVKFYQILARINENLIGIRRAVESATVLRL